jgi:hypothetical protein
MPEENSTAPVEPTPVVGKIVQLEGANEGQAAEQAPEPVSSNWQDDPAFRESQRKLNKQAEDARAATAAAQQQLAAAQAENQSLRQASQEQNQFIQSYDPDAAQALQDKAYLNRVEAELRNERQQNAVQTADAEARQNFYDYHIVRAQEQGLNPYDPMYQAALNQAMAQGDPGIIEGARLEMAIAAREAAEPAAPEPESAQPAGAAAPGAQPAQQPAQAPQNVVLPGAGGGVIDTASQLQEKYKAEQALYPGNTDKLFGLKEKYRGLGLDIPEY